MIRSNHFLQMAFLIVLYSASTQASADASALAIGSDGSWGWATKSTQKEANRVALAGCKKMDCKLQITKGLARAESKGRTAWAYSPISINDAKKKALEACGDASCRITFERTDPGFYSLAKSKLDNDGNATYHLTYGYANSDEADKKAKQNCEKAAGRDCDRLWSGAIPGIFNVASTPSRSPAPPEKSCRPNTPSVRCSFQCTNGNCAVTYENGCRMRIRVQPRLDPFTNKVIFPDPSC